MWSITHRCSLSLNDHAGACVGAMNLSEALNAALPEIPKTHLARSRPPCFFDQELVVREDELERRYAVVALQRDTRSIFRFTPSQWRLWCCLTGLAPMKRLPNSTTSRRARR